ncbi:hypothetical protein BCR37DRAFT_379570, partial [Protomyces lactucae-debilis]
MLTSTQSVRLRMVSLKWILWSGMLSLVRSELKLCAEYESEKRLAHDSQCQDVKDGAICVVLPSSPKSDKCRLSCIKRKHQNVCECKCAV